MIFKKRQNPVDATSREMLTLIQRLAVGSDEIHSRMTAFIAARPGEGTSTIARKYATALAFETAQKVLLIKANSIVRRHFRLGAPKIETGIVDAITNGDNVSAAIQQSPEGIFLCNWVGNEKNRGAAGKIAREKDFWENLLTLFDVVIIDAPSLQSSFDGIVLASMADATVIVVEAEATRQPVVENLRDNLETSGAKIAGVIMNKRRFYIPQRIYKRL